LSQKKIVVVELTFPRAVAARSAAFGAKQPFARWPVLGAWLRDLNDRREK
jgi:hypothetical protein